MPDEVFEMWIKPIVEGYGWPFETSSDETKGTKWYYVLARLPLTFWSDVKWMRFELELSGAPLSALSRMAIDSIIQGALTGCSTITANVTDSKQRFGACAAYVRAHGAIPKSIIGLMRVGSLEIVDGNHRLAALIHVGAPDGYKVPFWMPVLK
jgi:hypothetical protein